MAKVFSLPNICLLGIRLFVVSLFLASCTSTQAQPLDPLDFASLGTLNLPAGDYTIDTDTLTIFDNTAPGVPLFTGVADDQNGQATPSVVPEIAVFAFNDINLDPTVNVAVIGSRALALLSQGDAIIGTPLSVDAPFNNWDGLPSIAGPGGYAGGASDLVPGETTDLRDSRLFVPGFGPGGGNSAVPGPGAHISQGSASFGGSAFVTSGVTPSTTYGNLLQTLQGGSGGASTSVKDLLVSGNLDVLPAAGVGGGGAIEIGAVGAVRIDADISANGGAQLTLSNPVDGLFYDTAGKVGGGSGGGIRVHGAQVEVNAGLSANYSFLPGNPSAGTGGGGRVLVLNRTSDLPLFLLGIDDISSTSYFDNLSVAGAGTQGTMTVSPIQSVVPMGETMRIEAPSLELTVDLPFLAGGSLILPTPVEVVLTNARVMPGGTADVGTGAVNRYTLELDGLDATIIGTGALTNKDTLSGTGRVEVPTINAASGTINATNDALVFTQSVSNATGGQINAIGSTLSFDGGLTSDGEINLINSTVSGDVVNDGAVSLAGTNTFTGTVSGSGTFTGTGTGTFAGVLSPGNSPGVLTFEGDIDLESTAVLEIEIGGTTPGVDYDRVEVGGFATLEGELGVSLFDGFVPELGDNFGFLFASGGFDASFSALNLPDLSAQGLGWQLNPGGATLFLTVVAGQEGDFDGDGDVDGADFLTWQRDPSVGDIADWQSNYGSPTSLAASSTVPEPTAAALVLAALGLVSSRRRPKLLRFATLEKVPFSNG